MYTTPYCTNFIMLIELQISTILNFYFYLAQVIWFFLVNAHSFEFFFNETDFTGKEETTYRQFIDETLAQQFAMSKEYQK